MARDGENEGKLSQLCQHESGGQRLAGRKPEQACDAGRHRRLADHDEDRDPDQQRPVLCGPARVGQGADGGEEQRHEQGVERHDVGADLRREGRLREHHARHEGA
jgi:hypothetical protein